MMKSYRIWYLGYVISAIFMGILLAFDLNVVMKVIVTELAAASFSVAFVQIAYNKTKEDPEYIVSMKDERNLMIGDKTNSIMSIYYCSALGFVGVVCMTLEYYVPGIIIFITVMISPFVSIFIQKYYEKKF